MNKVLIILSSFLLFQACSAKESEIKLSEAKDSCSYSRSSCYSLGEIYLEKKEYAKAKKAFKRACSIFDRIPINSSLAVSDVTFSCLQLSQLYKNGIGIPRNFNYAKQIYQHVHLRYKKECSAGNKYACKALKDIF